METSGGATLLGNEVSGFINGGNFLTRWVTVSFSRTTLPYEVSQLPLFILSFMSLYQLLTLPTI
jgi:hypothetical protein